MGKMSEWIFCARSIGPNLWHWWRGGGFAGLQIKSLVQMKVQRQSIKLTIDIGQAILTEVFYKSSEPTFETAHRLQLDRQECKKQTNDRHIATRACERSGRKSRSTLQPISVTPTLRSVPAPRPLAPRSSPSFFCNSRSLHCSAPPDFRLTPLRQLSSEYP